MSMRTFLSELGCLPVLCDDLYLERSNSSMEEVWRMYQQDQWDEYMNRLCTSLVWAEGLLSSEINSTLPRAKAFRKILPKEMRHNDRHKSLVSNDQAFKFGYA
ncbi:hypothetical protein [Vibrio fortis]|uniref:hypothetical protein n=1 Tax=Vibrio fortis TaxID=212667 RepID=UPI001CD9FC41|nr:hypothetical protein [Vibrio fortis]